MEQVINTQEKKRRVGRPKTVYKKTGRKPMLDAKMIITISNCFRDGYNIEDTCTLSGISTTTYYNWIADANEDIAIGKHSIKVELLEAIKKGQIDYKHKLLENIRIAGLDPSRWQANAWILERKYADEFGQRLQENAKDETPMAINITVSDKKNPDKIKQMEKDIE